MKRVGWLAVGPKAGFLLGVYHTRLTGGGHYFTLEICGYGLWFIVGGRL